LTDVAWLAHFEQAMCKINDDIKNAFCEGKNMKACNSIHLIITISGESCFLVGTVVHGDESMPLVPFSNAWECSSQN